MKKDGCEKKRGPSEAAMARMARLLDAFGKGHLIGKSSGFSIAGKVMSIEEHGCIPEFVRLAYDDGGMVAGFDWAKWSEGRAIPA
jgi:hypothetical protein